MLTWHLCNGRGESERTCTAGDIEQATDRLRPIPEGWFVCSDVSFRMGWKKPEAPDLCIKCFRLPCSPGAKKCEGCRKRDMASSSAANKKNVSRDAKWRANLTTEARQALYEREKERKREQYREEKAKAGRPYRPRSTQPKGS